VRRHFNTAGPCKPDIHYMLPALRRVPQLLDLIDRQAYFVVHAPRQVGKTTSLMSLGRELTREGRYTSLLVSMQVGAPFPNDPGAAELAVLHSWMLDAHILLPAELRPPPWPDAPPGQRIAAALQTWARTSPRPLVLFIDEIDALHDEALVSALRQIRDRYPHRPADAPWSLALVGLRDVRDYKAASGSEGRLGTASPFNVKVESLTIRDFTADEVAELYQQHTDDTGQRFTPDALAAAFDETQGQPWLVNALARQATEVVVPDTTTAITPDDILKARQLLIQRMDTHLDSLADKLREPRVRRIIAPMIAGESLPDASEEDLRYLTDLGLLRKDPGGGFVIANPTYREVIVRYLSFSVGASLPHIAPTWLTPAGRLDIHKLLEAFLEFWREHGEALLGTATYPEIAPHLVLMAFLHRVENGGGVLNREYAVRRGRIDLVLRYGPDRVAMELKVWRDGDKDPRPRGLKQLDGYLAGLGLDTGWLIVFDQRAGLGPIEDRTRTESATTPSGRVVTIIHA
jgi:hypothetical protein